MKYVTTVNDKTYEIEIGADGEVTINGTKRSVDFQSISQSLFSVLIDNKSIEGLVELRDGRYQILMKGDLYDVEVLDERDLRLKRSSAGFGEATGEVIVRSPMPGLIVDVRVKEGQQVKKGDPLCILESMKMENEIKAPKAGTVNRVHIIKGEQVEQNKPMVTLN